jgi:hypothetical protein
MYPRRFSIATLALCLALVLAACTRDGGEAAAASGPTATTSPHLSPVETPSPTPSPTEPPLPEHRPPTHGASTTDCVDGWVTPAADSARYSSPIGVIRRTTGVRGPLEIVDMRYFEGPESPPSDKGYLLVIQRWYVKLFARRDYAFAGRFLVEARRFGQGVAAVAPYDTKGFASPDWTGFQLSADPTPKAYPGLPGEWAGLPYDFVKGGEGLTIPGLPDQVTGCLDGT